MYSLVIRNGRIYDGTGSPPIEGDLALHGDTVAAVGAIDESEVGADTEVIDATGRIVTPGFVDAHTHYDGQVTWDPFVQPSTFHGVTTIVTGNCGVGFAPCQPEQRDWLIGLMEGVEDIPGTALHEGIQWDWESFPEYLDALEQRPLAIDVGTQVPHGAVRTYVMGERGARHEEATAEEIAAMKRVVKEAIEAGALGFSTSRTEKHRDSSGVLTPSITVHEAELVGIAEALGELDAGVLQGISDFYEFDAEFAMFRAMVEASGRPCSITVEQQDARPEWWRQLLDAVTQAQADGLPMRGQVPPRATGVLLGLTATLNPFSFHPSYRHIHPLPLDEKVAELRKPEIRAALLSEESTFTEGLVGEIIGSWHKMYRLGEPANYEPAPEESFAGLAESRGCTPQEIAYDVPPREGGRRADLPPAVQLPERRSEPRPGDAGAPPHHLRSERRRRPLRRDLRRELPDDVDPALGSRPRPGTSAAVGASDLHADEGDRGTGRPPRPRRPRPRLQGGRERHRLRCADAPRTRPSNTTFRPAAGVSVQRASGYDLTIVAGEIAFRGGEADRGPQRPTRARRATGAGLIGR